MPSKIQIKVGHVEILFEGEEEFIENKLLDFVGDIKEIFDIEELKQPPTSTTEPMQETPTMKPPKLTVNSVASRLGGVEEGGDIVLASAVKLQIIDGKDKFTRKEILEEMKKATNYYKQSYGSNLSHYLQQLVKNNKLNEIGKEVYALRAGAIKELRNALTK